MSRNASRSRLVWVASLSLAASVPLTVASNGRAPWFADEAAFRGLRFTYRSGHDRQYLMPEIMGGGAAVFDMEQDGDLDVYFVQGGSLKIPSKRSGNRLFRNTGDGRFQDVTPGSGTDVRAYSVGVTAGDYDNDGDVDLYVTNVGPNSLLRNDGRGRFIDVATGAGVAERRWSSSAAFLDYDADGDLDLYVANYINWSITTEINCYAPTGVLSYCGPKSYRSPASDTLYRNDGNGRFSEVSRAAGLHSAFGNGLGVVPGDFNRDGTLDVFVANDGSVNQLWMNTGKGRFEDRALTMGVALDQDGVFKAGMGTHAADVDEDGDLDLLVVNLNGESDSFFRNEGDYFIDDTAVVGLRLASRPFTRFGTALLDFDNDGRLDLFEANGRVSHQATRFANDPFAEPSLLFRGTPKGRFEEVQPRGGTARPLIATSRAAAFGDLDNDGGIDIVVVNRDSPAFLLHNIVKPRGHWIGFRALEEHNRDALGAEIVVTVGKRRITRDVRVAYSYLAANDPRVHFGLGAVTAIDDVTVRWVGGKVESFGRQRAGAYVTLVKGKGKTVPRKTS